MRQRFKGFCCESNMYMNYSNGGTLEITSTVPLIKDSFLILFIE